MVGLPFGVAQEIIRDSIWTGRFGWFRLCLCAVLQLYRHVSCAVLLCSRWRLRASTSLLILYFASCNCKGGQTLRRTHNDKCWVVREAIQRRRHTSNACYFLLSARTQTFLSSTSLHPGSEALPLSSSGAPSATASPLVILMYYKRRRRSSLNFAYLLRVMFSACLRPRGSCSTNYSAALRTAVQFCSHNIYVPGNILVVLGQCVLPGRRGVLFHDFHDRA